MSETSGLEPLIIQCQPFEQLDAHTLYELLRLRTSVFIVEQNCPYLDPDGKDPLAWHILAHRAGELVGTARILMPGESYADASSIGRVANKASQRGLKVGYQLFERAVQECCRLFPDYPIRIGAQRYLEGFYGQFGFEKQGERYLEDGIVHIIMERRSEI